MGSHADEQRPLRRKAVSGAPDALERALELHRRGKLDEAEISIGAKKVETQQRSTA